MLVLFGAREAGCFREVAALYSDYYRQVPLYFTLVVYIVTCTVHNIKYNEANAQEHAIILKHTIIKMIIHQRRKMTTRTSTVLLTL